jgi:serine/threonine protein kinase
MSQSSCIEKKSKADRKIQKQKLQERMTDQGWVIGETNDINDFYAMGEQIGSPGSYGHCVRGEHIETGQTRAIKVIPKAKLTKSEYVSLRTEIKVMRRLRHKNICKLFDVFETFSTLYLVQELCNGGELFDQISSRGICYDSVFIRILL